MSTPTTLVPVSLHRTTALQRPSDERCKALNKELSIPVVNNYFAIYHYYDAANKVFQSFQEAYQRRNLDKAYVFGKRYSWLVLEALPTHQAYHTPKYRHARQKHIQQVRNVARQLEHVTGWMDVEAAEVEEERQRQQADWALADSPSNLPDPYFAEKDFSVQMVRQVVHQLENVTRWMDVEALEQDERRRQAEWGLEQERREEEEKSPVDDNPGARYSSIDFYYSQAAKIHQAFQDAYVDNSLEVAESYGKRYCQLCLDQIPLHESFDDPSYRVLRQKHMQQAYTVVEQLEQIAQWLTARKMQQQQRAALEAQRYAEEEALREEERIQWEIQQISESVLNDAGLDFNIDDDDVAFRHRFLRNHPSTGDLVELDGVNGPWFDEGSSHKNDNLYRRQPLEPQHHGASSVHKPCYMDAPPALFTAEMKEDSFDFDDWRSECDIYPGKLVDWVPGNSTSARNL